MQPGIPKFVCRALMETTSGGGVVALIAAAAGTRVDDDHMEVGVQP